MANLAENLIIGTLLCLPVKSIARFRCVSKSWYDFLTHEFVNKKLDHDIRKGNFKLLTTRKERHLKYKIKMRSLMSDKVVKMRYPFNELLGDIQILGSCNGLICAKRMNHIIYVWNPCSKEYKLIPPKKPQSNGPLAGTDHIAYGFGPFGHDSKTSDYKL
ncbi:putative F-box protein At3g16210 [Papaver somniferum]|uniref:putative F-box protein At3g16210 n=1 Tax=Papaver somniferum TaxID=3469 RepID=UPI000E6FE8A9|nr:putative F-box protein At3g16210 [Papaver somniferum]